MAHLSYWGSLTPHAEQMTPAAALRDLLQALDLPLPDQEIDPRSAAGALADVDGSQPVAQIPRSVRAALEEAPLLAAEAGREALHELLGASGLPEGPAAVLIAAFRAPDQVIAAARTLGRQRWPVWELAGRTAARGRVLAAEVLRARLEEVVRPALEARGRVGAHVVVVAEGPERWLRVASGGPPVRGWQGDVRLYGADELVLDRPRGRLRLAVPAVARRELYRAALGELVHGDRGWFGGPTVTLAPLLASPEAALRPTLTVGCARVAGIELAGDGPGDVLALGGRDTLGWLHRLDLSDQLNRVQAVTLELQLDARAAVVELRPPHLVVYDRPREEPAVRAFLGERGWLGGPPGT